MDLAQKINQKEITAAVLGLGYVGLPLAGALVQKGFKTIGIDIDREKIERLKNGYLEIPFLDQNSLDGIELTTDFGLLRKCDVAIICVPTPVTNDFTPDISLVQSAAQEIARHIPEKKLVIIESTISPGALREKIYPLFLQCGLFHDKDFYLVYAPERIDPGNNHFTLKNTPRIVGGMSSTAGKLASLFYSHVVDSITEVSSPEIAEAVKLLENSFRSLNIAFINEIDNYCRSSDLDVYEVINAAATKPFGFMPFYPGPGVGGHCLTTDPYFLTWQARLRGMPCRLLELATSLNRERPWQVFIRVKKALKEKGKELNQARILLLGITYKKNVPDIRESPAINLFKILRDHHSLVSFYDPFVSHIEIAGENYNSEPLDKVPLEEIDCTVITTDHDGIDYQSIQKNVSLLIDTRGVL